MKKVIFVAVIILAVPFVSFAGFVEFNPQKAQFIPPSQRQTEIAKKSSTNQNPSSTGKVLGMTSVSESYIKQIVDSVINKMLSEGAIKGEKGEKGDPGISISQVDPEAPGIQTTYITGGTVGPDVGTILGVTNLSSDLFHANSAELGEISASGGLTVEGDVELQGNTIVNNINVGQLTSDSGAYLSEGGDWVNASSRDLKENFATTSPQEILSKITNLPIYTWNYKSQNSEIKHLGPLAEDFYEQFNLGGEKGSKSISTIDPSGVALAGVQALNEKISGLFDFSAITGYFKTMGLEIADGILKAKNFIAESITVKNLEVGSEIQPAGITIFDRGTHQPVCIYSENNVLKSEAGKCGGNVVVQETLVPDPQQAEATIIQILGEQPVEPANNNPTSNILTSGEETALTPHAEEIINP